MIKMILEEELIKLNEEDIFGPDRTLLIEETELMTNMATLSNMVVENINALDHRGRIERTKAEKINRLQANCIEALGNLLAEINEY